ncbi:hypothetical protein ACFX13_003521 [Malus domestica]
MSSPAYIDAMGEQYNQGYRLGLRERFEIFRHYAMKVDVNEKWATIDYYKALVVGATIWFVIKKDLMFHYFNVIYVFYYWEVSHLLNQGTKIGLWDMHTACSAHAHALV